MRKWLRHACFFLVAAAVFQSKFLSWIILSAAGLLFILGPKTVSGKLAVLTAALRGHPRRATARREDGEGQGPTATKTKISSVTFQSISPRLSLRGIELRLSDGVIVRIGKVSFGFRRLKQMVRRQPLQKGKGKAIVVTVENAKVLLPASFLEQSSTTKAASESASSGKGSTNAKSAIGSRDLEKAIPLPAAALLCARFVAIEVCDLRMEFATANEATNISSSSGVVGSDDDDRTLDDTGGADAAPAARAARAAPAASGVRAIELVGVRLVGFVSRRSSCLTVSVENKLLLHVG